MGIPKILSDGGRCKNDVVMAAHDPFGLAGRPRSINEAGEIQVEAWRGRLIGAVVALKGIEIEDCRLAGRAGTLRGRAKANDAFQTIKGKKDRGPVELGESSARSKEASGAAVGQNE